MEGFILALSTNTNLTGNTISFSIYTMHKKLRTNTKKLLNSVWVLLSQYTTFTGFSDSVLLCDDKQVQNVIKIASI